MTVGRNQGLFGFAKQTALGTPATAPLFTVPLESGAVQPSKELGTLPRVGSTLARLGQWAQRVTAGGTVVINAHPEALGLLLYEMMGVQATTAGPPHIHRFSMADEYPALPLTVWSLVGPPGYAGAVWRTHDAYIQRMVLGGASGENIGVTLDIVGFDSVPLSSIPAVSGTGSSAEDMFPRFKYEGSVAKLDPAGGAAPAEFTGINSWELEIDRAPNLRYGTRLQPQRISPTRDVNFSVNLDFDTLTYVWEFFNRSMTGAADGSGGFSQQQPVGSFDILSGKDPSNYTGSLRIISGGDTIASPNPQGNWVFNPGRPEASSEPEVIAYDVPGILTAPPSGTSEFQVLLANLFSGDY